jgi:hypothetical protein
VFAGELLDRLMNDPWALLDAEPDAREALARVVRSAIELRARAVGARLS